MDFKFCFRDRKKEVLSAHNILISLHFHASILKSLRSSDRKQHSNFFNPGLFGHPPCTHTLTFWLRWSSSKSSTWNTVWKCFLRFTIQLVCALVQTPLCLLPGLCLINLLLICISACDYPSSAHKTISSLTFLSHMFKHPMLLPHFDFASEHFPIKLPFWWVPALKSHDFFDFVKKCCFTGEKWWWRRTLVGNSISKGELKVLFPFI